MVINMMCTENAKDYLQSSVKEVPLGISILTNAEYGDIKPEQRNKKKTDIQIKFDFRDNDISELILAILNAKIGLIILEAVKEVNEFLIYSHIQSKGFIYGTVIYNTILNLIKCFSFSNKYITQICTKTIFAVFHHSSSMIESIDVS